MKKKAKSIFWKQSHVLSCWMEYLITISTEPNQINQTENRKFHNCYWWKQCLTIKKSLIISWSLKDDDLLFQIVLVYFRRHARNNLLLIQSFSPTINRFSQYYISYNIVGLLCALCNNRLNANENINYKISMEILHYQYKICKKTSPYSFHHFTA